MVMMVVVVVVEEEGEVAVVAGFAWWFEWFLSCSGVGMIVIKKWSEKPTTRSEGFQ